MVPRSVIPTLSDPPPVTPLPRSDPVSKLLDLLGSVGYALWTNVMRRLKAWVVKNDSKIFNLKYNITHEIQQQYTSVPEGLNPATYLEVLARGLVIHDVGRARLVHNVRNLFACRALVNSNLKGVRDGIGRSTGVMHSNEG